MLNQTAIPQVEPDNADGHTLFCMVYTIGKQHEKAGVVVRDSWASRCDGFVVMSDTEDPSLPAARVTHEGKEEYNNIWQKVRSSRTKLDEIVVRSVRSYVGGYRIHNLTFPPHCSPMLSGGICQPFVKRCARSGSTCTYTTVTSSTGSTSAATTS